MKWRLLVVALLCIAPLSVEQCQAQSMNDTFSTNGFLDPRIWSTLSPPPTSTVTVSVTNQQLQVGMGPGIGGGGVISNCSLSGDFDVQVDYMLLNWPTNNNHSIQLGAYDLGAVGVLRYSALSPSPELYEFGPGSTAHTPTSDTSGQFRLARTGTTLSGFFRMGGSWVLVGSETVSTIPTRIHLDLGTNGTFAIGGIVVAFDNFLVNSGTIVCPSQSQKNPIIIIPGILGTSIFRETAPITPNALIWLDPVQAFLSFSDDYLRDLALGMDGLPLVQTVPGPILDGSIAAGGFATNRYGKLVDFFKQAGYQENILLFTFPYDWRLDNRTTADNLNYFIENIVVPKSGRSQVDIIAHSMGGLVVRDYASRFGEQRLDKVMYLGTPHTGAPASFGPLASNDSLAAHFISIPFVNSQTLAEVSRTFPSLFQLLSRQTFIFSRLLQRDLSLDETYLQPPTGFGFLANSAWVGVADAFYQTISGQLTVPQFEIAGSGIPTLNQFALDGDPSSRPRVLCSWSADGDGTVPIQSATGAPGVATAFYVDQIKHEDLPNDSTTQQVLLQILQNNLGSLPAGVSTQPFTLFGVVEWCSGSPIKVTITDSGSQVDGVAADASLRTDIPLSSFFVHEANESGLLPPGQEYGVKIVGTDTGVFSLTFNQKDANGVITSTTKFSEIPIAAGSIGTFLLSPGVPSATLALDLDGNGSIDTTVTANQVLTPEASNSLLAGIIRTFGINEETEESLLAKVRAAGEAVHEGRFREARHIYTALLRELNKQVDKHVTAAQAHGLAIIINSLIHQLPSSDRDLDPVK